MIRAEGLSKVYDSKAVVRDLTFSIEDREIVGFLGLNGAGKTTCLRMLAGLLAPSTGRIRIDGQDLLEDPLNLRWRIGFLPETPPLYEDMTVEGYLTFAARLRGRSDAGLDVRVAEVLELTGLQEVQHKRIEILSHGYRQRLGIAQAIVHEPSLVILDEPINGLDPVQIVEMRELIRSLKEHHTVLVSSHILPEISQTCDRLLILKNGELVAQGTEDDLGASMRGGARSATAHVVGDRAALEAALTAAEAVASYEVAELGDVLEVKASLTEERPEILAAVIVGAGLGLRRLEAAKSELESLFIELTQAED